MRDVELYRHLLGLESPWTVRSVELNVPEQRVDVWAQHPEGIRWPCPECGAELGLYDHTEERVWRHLDSCQLGQRGATGLPHELVDGGREAHFAALQEPVE
jgi:transposase